MNNKIVIVLLTTLSFVITTSFTLDVPQQKNKKKHKTSKHVVTKSKIAVVDTTKQKLKLEIAPLDSLLVTNKKEILKKNKCGNRLDFVCSFLSQTTSSDQKTIYTKQAAFLFIDILKS